MKWFLIKLTAVIGAAMLVASVEIATWSSPNVTPTGGIAITGVLFLIVAFIAAIWTS